MPWYIENEDALRYKVEATPTVLENISRCFGLSKLMLLNGVAHQLEWQEITPISSFYRSNKAKVSRAIDYINTDADGERIKTTLLAHIHETMRLLDNLAEQDLITKARPVAVSLEAERARTDDNKLVADLKPLDQYIEPYTATRTETTTEKDIEAIKRLFEKNPHLTPAPLPKLGETKNYIREGFRIKRGSEKAVAEFMLRRPYKIERDTSLRNQEIQHEYYKAINIFAVEVGLTTEEKIQQPPHFMVSTRDDDRVVVNGLTLTLSSFLEATLSVLKDRYDRRVADARRPSTAVNIRKDYKGDYIPKPPIDMTIADMEQLSENPESVKTINKVYRNSQALDADGGLLATVNDPSLFDMLPAQYQEPTKLLGLMNRATRRGMVALARYLHDNPEPPAILDTTEVAKAYGAYDEQIKKHGRLPTHYLNDIITELTIIKGTNTTYTYYDNTLKKEMIGSIKFFDFDISTDGRTIKNLRYSQDYIDRLNDQKQVMLHLALPKSIDYLRPFDQDIAFKILQRFVGVRGEKQQKRRMSKTINGEDLKIELAELYKGYINARNKSERQRAKKRTIEALDEIKAKGDIIADYKIVEEKGYKYYAVLTPSDFIRNAYKDKTLNEIIESQYKDEQKRRRTDLKRLVDLIRKDLGAKKDTTEYLDATAEDIGLKDRTELGYYLFEPNKRKKITPREIDDELYGEIREQLNYYDDEN